MRRGKYIFDGINRKEIASMADLVTSAQDVTKNIITLLSYRDSKNQGEKKFHNGLIRKGRLFVVDVLEDQFVFAPSRFAGYFSNTYKKHEANSQKDGKETNPVLTKMFRKPLDATNGDRDLMQLYEVKISRASWLVRL
jgi:hypothetical protein